MKKKVLSLLLAVCLIVGMLPLAASAADGPFKVNEQGYEKLAAALAAAGEAGTVEAVGTYTVSEDDATALGAAKTNIVVKSTGDIKVEAENFKGLVGYQGSITVEAGGVLQLPKDKSGTEAWFGGVDARMNITAGSITISGLNNFASGGCVWTLSSGAQVEVPTGKVAFLHVGADDTTFGVQLVIPEGASMSVSGILNAVQKNKPAMIDLDGTLKVVSNGEIKVAQGAKVSVGPKAEIQVAGGALTVYDKTSVVGESDSSTVILSDSGTFKTSDGENIVTGDDTYVWSYLDPNGTETTEEKGTWKSAVEDWVVTAEYWKSKVANTVVEDTYKPSWLELRNLTYFYGKAKEQVEKYSGSSKSALESRLGAVNTFITTTLTKLDMSGKAITSAGGASDNIGILAGYTGLTWLNLSKTELTEIGGLATLTSLTYLDVSQNPDLTAAAFGALSGLNALKELNFSGTSIEDVGGLVASGVADTIETLNISDTKVTKLESVWDASEKKSAFPELNTLTAKNLELTSISGLAEIASADDFDSTGITWDLSGSELTDTPDNKAHLDKVKAKFTDGIFSAPTIPGSSTGGGSTGGGGGGGSTSYTVTVNSAENGKVTASPTSAAKGDKVTLTVSPAEGYKLGTLTVKDASGKTVLTTKVSDTEYTFTMPEGSVTVSATFVEKNATPFTDVKTSDWWYEAVKYVYENKLMAGTSTTTFAPTAKLNRAQAVQILYNLEGQPAVTGTADFTDTAAAGDWAVKAITWGAKNNVVAGVGDGKFDPTANVTREQFAQMMYNYAKYKGYDLSAAGDLNNFSDVSKVSDWAKTALSWANGEGLINGNENGTLNPVGTAIRGEAASIMSKFDQNVAK